MGLFGGGGDAGEIAKKMARREEKRLAEAEERAAKRESFETIEGQGIMERADISLGNDMQTGEVALDNEDGTEKTPHQLWLSTGLVI